MLSYKIYIMKIVGSDLVFIDGLKTLLQAHILGVQASPLMLVF